MATYYVSSTGTNTSPYDTWAKAATAFGTAVTAATASGDIIKVHYTHQEEVSATTTYTFANNVNVISVNKDSSDALTVMGTSGWLGNSTASRNVAFRSVYKVYMYGITARNAGTSSASLLFADQSSDGAHFDLEDCYFWVGASGTASAFRLDVGTVANTSCVLKKCTIRFSNTAQAIQSSSHKIIFENCVVSSDGSAPTELFRASSISGSPDILMIGCDLSHVTGTLIASQSNVSRVIIFSQCKLGANVTILATQTPANKSSGAAYVFDCSSGDTHTFFGYYDAFGSCVSDTGIYYTTGAAAQSWKITTTANCSYYTPFTSPFVDFYNTGTSSITPYFEILRDGSTTAFQNDEVWGEFFVKTTSGSTQSTPYNDRMALLGTPANQAAGAGTGSWTGEAASAWSGKIDSGSAVTPAENGHIRGRVVVGEPSITVYVDPQVRT